MSEARRDANFITSILGADETTGVTIPVELVSATKRLKVDSNSSDGCSSVGTGRTAIGTAGVAWQMPSASCKRVNIQTPASNGNLTNGGVIVVGDSNVVAAEATRRGVALYPTQSEWFNVSNTNLLFIDATDDGAVAIWYTET